MKPNYYYVVFGRVETLLLQVDIWQLFFLSFFHLKAFEFLLEAFSTFLQVPFLAYYLSTYSSFSRHCLFLPERGQ
jgi:hypothetical protein